jgi:hypothetical protein
MVQQAKALIHGLVAAGKPTQLISLTLQFVDHCCRFPRLHGKLLYGISVFDDDNFSSFAERSE